MPRWLKILIWVVVIVVVVFLLFTEIFPRVERMLEDPTMGAEPGAIEAPEADPGQAVRSPR